METNRLRYLKSITLNALMMAMTLVATLFLKVPVSSDGYVNPGDAIIFISASMTGGVSTMISGGIGSMLADFIGGYGYWAPWTLIIKGTEGLLAGLACTLIKKKVDKVSASRILRLVACAVSSLWMVAGYFVARWLIISGSVPAALAEVPANLVQAGVSLLIAGIVITSGLADKNSSEYFSMKKHSENPSARK